MLILSMVNLYAEVVTDIYYWVRYLHKLLNHQQKGDACSCCKSILTGHRHILDKEAYPNNVTFEKMLESNPRQNQYVVCAKCLKKN